MHKIINMHNWVSELPETIRKEIHEKCVRRKLADGECLYHLGEEATECFQIMSGRLKVCTFNHIGQELVHVYLKEGDCIGDWALIINERRMNSTFACGDTEVNVLRKSRFNEFYNKYPEIPIALNKVMAHRLRFTFMLAEDASLLPLRQRLARAILRMGYSSGIRGDNGQTIIEDTSHDELAKVLGSARQSVSRELKKLEYQGSIEINYGKIIITDIEELSKQYDSLIALEQVVPKYSEDNEKDASEE